MTRVAHITTVHPVFDTRIFYKECKSLFSAGYDVTLIVQHDRNEIIDGIQIIALPKAKNRMHRMLVLTLKAFKHTLNQKAYICHIHDPELIPVGILLKLLRKKVIYDVHEDYGKQLLSKAYISKIIKRPIAFSIKGIEYLSSKLFNGIITATDMILMNFSMRKNVVSVRNFPILTNSPVIKKNIRNYMEIFNLIYVGVIAEIRGISHVIRALNIINSDRQLKLTLCGKFYPYTLEEEVKRLNGFQKIEYLGWIKQNNVSGILEKSDAGIVSFLPEPNHIHAMPNKLFEYMAAGLPVIASDFPLWKEIIEGNKCGITVDPTSPEEIAKAIEFLIDHPEICKEMGENGRRAVEEKYNWENENKKLLKIYKDILNVNLVNSSMD